MRRPSRSGSFFSSRLAAIAAVAGLALTVASLVFLWRMNTSGPAVVRLDGTVPAAGASLTPIPPAAPAPPIASTPDQAEQPPPDDLLTDLAGAVLAAYHPVADRTAELPVDLASLASRYSLEEAGAVTPALLSLGYFVAAEPLVQRMAWHARQRGHGPEALAAAARTMRRLAACTEADASPNCVFGLDLMAQLAAGGPADNAAAVTGRARALLRDLAERLDRAAAGM